jgi:hypothetical protein
LSPKGLPVRWRVIIRELKSWPAVHQHREPEEQIIDSRNCNSGYPPALGEFASTVVDKTRRGARLTFGTRVPWFHLPPTIVNFRTWSSLATAVSGRQIPRVIRRISDGPTPR